MIYLLPLILILVGIYYYDYRCNNKGRFVLICVITIIFIFLGGLHYRVGFDSLDYERFYHNLHPLNTITKKSIESSRFEPGFVILASFTKLFSPEPILLNFIISSFVCWCVTFFFIRNTRHPFFALLLFYFFSFTLLIFEQIREAVAVGFFLLAWPAFKSNNWFKWYVLSFCAMAFHTSATFMIILPLILLPGIRNIFIFGKRALFLMGGVFCIAMILQYTFSKYIEIIAVTQSLEELTKKYENTSYIEGKLNIFGMANEFIRWILYPLIALLFYGKVKSNHERSKGLNKIEMFVIISVCISIFQLGVPIISRFNNYFYFFPIVLMSDMIFMKLEVNKKRIKLKFIGWTLFFLPLILIQFKSAYWTDLGTSGKYKLYMGYYPYTSYLDKENIQVRMTIKRKFRS